MKLNRKTILVMALLLSVAMATTGTLAYLTDRDSEANVFTIGNVEIDLNEEFEQGAELLPGVDIAKNPTITNTGSNDAWVWMTIAVPTYVDVLGNANDNAIHWNWIGGTCVSELGKTPSITEAKLNQYKELGYIDESVTLEQIQAGDFWIGTGTECIAEGIEIEGDDNTYNLYVFKYNKPLAPGQTTVSGPLCKVYLDANIDVDPEGNVHHVEGGVVTDLNWNINDNDSPVIYVSAYAIQSEGFADVEAAYAAYNKQWGDNGYEWAEPDDVIDSGRGDDPTVTYKIPADAYRVTSSAELEAAVKSGETVLLLAAGEYDINGCGNKELTLIGEDPDKTIINIVGGGQGEANGQLDYGLDSSTVTFMNLTIKSNNKTYAGFARLTGTFKNVNFVNTFCLNGNSTFEYCTLDISGDQYNIWTWGAPTATFNNCTFNSDGKAVLLYGMANTKLTLNNCEFNDNGGLTARKAAVEIGNDYNKSYELIVNNTKVNGYEENDQGIPTGSTLWANKNSMGSDKLNVVIDGVDIY